MGVSSKLQMLLLGMLQSLLLIVVCSISACSENTATEDKAREKPPFVNEALSYLPFASSNSDNPPTSIGLVNADNHSQNLEIAENSVSGNIAFLYETEFNFRGDSSKSPTQRDKDHNATFIYAGEYNANIKMVTNHHADSFLYIRGGRLYRQKIWQTILDDAQPISTETQFFKNQLCSIATKGKKYKTLAYVGHDYQNIDNSVIIYKLAKFTTNAENIRVKSCAADDVSWKLVRLGMSESDLPQPIQIQLTGGILYPIHNTSTGSLEGWIASDSSGAVHHFNADFSTFQQIPIPTHNGDSNDGNDWIVFLGVDQSATSAWFATHAQHIYQYDLQNKTLVNPAGSIDSAIDTLPDSNHQLQVYGAYKNDRYPIFQFDENFLYILVRNIVPVSVENGANQYQYLLSRIPLLAASSIPETLATFQAHDIGKMVLTQNKVVLSITIKSETREGTQFSLFDKVTPFSTIQTVLPSNGHQCLFNVFSYNDKILGNSVGIDSCQKPTTNSTHIHFFQFDESGQAGFVDSHHSRILSKVSTGNFNPFTQTSETQYLIVKRNVTSTNNAWIDSINIYDPATNSDIRQLGRIDVKNSAMTARIALMEGFSSGLVEYQSRQGHQKLFTFSTEVENSMTPFSPQFQTQPSNRWIAPFSLPN